jgi:hypothetical protein
VASLENLETRLVLAQTNSALALAAAPGFAMMGRSSLPLSARPANMQLDQGAPGRSAAWRFNGVPLQFG